MAKLKEAAKSVIIAFKGRAVPIGTRSEEDINDLALLAHKSQDKLLLDLFEKLESKKTYQNEKYKKETEPTSATADTSTNKE